MSYPRVIPRDLFNEADLLKCLGQLWLKLDERRDHRARLVHAHRDQAFDVQQNPSDGSISCLNVMLAVDGLGATLFRPLNARERWPLYAVNGQDEEVRVFDLDGELAPEFWIAITEGKWA